MPKKQLPNEDRIEQQIILPKRRSGVWIFLFILLLLAAAGASWYAWSRHRGALVTDFESCRKLGGAILESYPEQCVLDGKTFTNPTQQISEQPAPTEETAPEPKLESYTDTTNKFSVQYPDNLTQAETEVFAPYTNSQVGVPAQKFTHTIEKQYCNPKGDCVPKTTDFSIAFSVVNSSLDKINQSKIKSELLDSTYGSNKFRTFSQGVEGEGIYYYFIALPNGKSLMISRTYLDESVLTAYTDAPGFISKSNQDKLAEQILASLSFGTASLKTYTNKDFKFSFSYPAKYTVIDKLQKNANSDGTDFLDVQIVQEDTKIMRLSVNHPGFGLEESKEISSGSISVNGVQMTKTISESKNASPVVRYSLYQFEKNKNAFIWFANLQKTDAESEKEFTAIVNSFSFIN